MAELGDFLTAGSERTEEVMVEMMDYEFLDKCTDPEVIRAVLRKLRSGEEGHYPDLTNHAEKRLLEQLPEADRSKILRMKSEPQPDEIYQATNELHCWEAKIARAPSYIKKDIDDYQCEPRRPSMADGDTDNPTKNEARIVLPSRDNDREDTVKQSDSDEWTRPVQGQPRRINSYDFRAWEQFDAEGELERLKYEEEQELIRNKELITSARVRVERNAQRRARKREEYLQELTKGRFEESVSPFERRRAADRERQKGNEYFKAKEFEEAFRCYTCSLAFDDTSSRAYNNRAAAAHKLEKFDQAEEDCTRAIRIDPDFKKAWIRRGMVRHSRGKYLKAIDDFTAALRLDPNDKYACKLREHSLAKKNEVEGPDEGGARKSTRLDGGRRLMVEEVDSLQEREEQDGAIAVRISSAVPPKINSLKRTMIAHGWIPSVREQHLAFTDAERKHRFICMDSKRRVSVMTDNEEEDHLGSVKFAEITPIEPATPESLMKKGQDLYLIQQFEESSQLFHKAWMIQQTSGAGAVQIANNIAACMLRQRDFSGVLKWTKLTLERDPQNEKALLRQWLALVELGEAEEADRSLRILECAPMEGTMRGIVEAHKEAIAASEEEIARASRCTNLRKEGNELMAAGQKKLAIEKYTAALREDPHNLPTSNNRAQAYLDLNCFEEAERDATTALESDPDNLKASYRRGRARFSRYKPDKRGACMDLCRVVSKDPNNEQAKALLSQVVKSLGIDEVEVEPKQMDKKGAQASNSMDHSKDAPHNHVSFDDGTEPGDEVSTDDERAVRDKEVQSMHPDVAKTHWPDAVVVVEEEIEHGSACSWCPLREDVVGKDAEVAHKSWVKGEELRAGGDLDRASEMYARGVVADPSNLLCWIGLSRIFYRDCPPDLGHGISCQDIELCTVPVEVHRRHSKYPESLEAAARALKIDPNNRTAAFCSALASLHLNAGDQTKELRHLQGQDVLSRFADFHSTQLGQGQDTEELEELNAFLHDT